MRVTRKKEHDRPLAEFPGWGLEIMMGLYGEEQVKSALAIETTTHPRTAARPADESVTAVEAAEFDAVTSVFARIRRIRRRR